MLHLVIRQRYKLYPWCIPLKSLSPTSFPCRLFHSGSELSVFCTWFCTWPGYRFCIWPGHRLCTRLGHRFCTWPGHRFCTQLGYTIFHSSQLFPFHVYSALTSHGLKQILSWFSSSFSTWKEHGSQGFSLPVLVFPHYTFCQMARFHVENFP